MRWPRVGGLRRLVSVGMAVFLAWSILLWLFLPNDNPVLLLMRFTTRRLGLTLLQAPFINDEERLFAPAEFPIDLHQDVVFIVKTGYATQGRLREQLDSLRVPDGPDMLQHLIVIADFSAQLRYHGRDIPIHDAVAAAFESNVVAGTKGYDRLLKYKDMTAAVKAGDDDRARAISEAVGWELDAMKFMPGLELAYRTTPDKKWYVMLDDDTYLLQPSLRMLLGHLDPSRPEYLGNAVGDYRGRFAHGGSSFVISQAAMHRLFRQNAHLLHPAYTDSLTETWGDKLVATTFIKTGVYLDERYSHLFNGERPWITRIRADRFCSPLVSFHGLADPSQMRQVSETFWDVKHAVLWGELWEIYGQPDVGRFAKDPIRLGWDHVGVTGVAREPTLTARTVESVDECLEACERRYGNCLAWTWDETTKACYTTPWVIIGEQLDGAFSGINVPQISKLLSQCSRQIW